MQRSLFVYRSPHFTDVLVLHRRHPNWSSELADYVDNGHAQSISYAAFSTITGVLDIPPFPVVVEVAQDNEVVSVYKPRKRKQRRYAKH